MHHNARGQLERSLGIHGTCEDCGGPVEEIETFDEEGMRFESTFICVDTGQKKSRGKVNQGGKND